MVTGNERPKDRNPAVKTNRDNVRAHPKHVCDFHRTESVDVTKHHHFAIRLLELFECTQNNLLIQIFCTNILLSSIGRIESLFLKSLKRLLLFFLDSSIIRLLATR